MERQSPTWRTRDSTLPFPSVVVALKQQAATRGYQRCNIRPAAAQLSGCFNSRRKHVEQSRKADQVRILRGTTFDNLAADVYCPDTDGQYPVLRPTMLVAG